MTRRALKMASNSYIYYLCCNHNQNRTGDIVYKYNRILTKQKKLTIRELLKYLLISEIYLYSAAFSVFNRSDTMVIGPTPPGTGVI
ncbi:hypothetical protein EV194_10394 [Natronoflexus pectinivorans]|uniref:Uncharacterized protein n=1 Tax=Natronoflexus pectinivorans TaxID=682526 RepID=A0A4R2GK38_9BACT|nr:hypothetical protein EV194_10394 [Natronoflexus pectinivorans]